MQRSWFGGWACADPRPPIRWMTPVSKNTPSYSWRALNGNHASGLNVISRDDEFLAILKKNQGANTKLHMAPIDLGQLSCAKARSLKRFMLLGAADERLPRCPGSRIENGVGNYVPRQTKCLAPRCTGRNLSVYHARSAAFSFPRPSLFIND